jgi:hypothetical protein
MTSRLILLLLLGAWLGATVFMWMVATQNFAVVERILAARSEGIAATASGLTPEQLRLVLRYQASEVNRLFFEGWGMLQPPLAVVVMLLAWRSGSGRWIVAATAMMLLITMFLQIYVVPETVRLGRILDFLPREPPPPEATPFWSLHHTYTGLDMLKFVMGLGVAFLAVKQASTQAGPARSEQPVRR